MHCVQPRGESLHPPRPGVFQMFTLLAVTLLTKLERLEITGYHQYEHKIC